jgi:murein DD-endopeptidase MepM/ murein hydrolase activator NlpD
MQLTAKLARVRIADDVFVSGDGILLPNITVSLGEDLRSSTCSFSLNDPGLLIGAKYREISVKEGGIQVPSELLDAPKQVAATTGTATTGAIPSAPPPGGLTNYAAGSQGEIVLGIVKECLKNGINDPTKIAFMIAVAEGESSLNHNAKGARNEGAGNYYGRSLVQITFDYNYKEASKVVGVDLIANPDRVHEPAISTALLIWGVKRGWCSRGGIDKYVTGPNSDLATAYRAIQGGVWGERYQTFFNKWFKQVPALIQQAGGAATPPPPPPPPPADPMSTATPAAATPPTTETPPPVEASKKGTEIIIEIAVGYSATWKEAIAFHFIHTETKTSWDADGKQTTTFGGKSIRWLLTRVPVTQSFENINFKQFTEMQVSGFNLKLDMEGSGLTFQHLSQDGQTPLDVLFRESKRLGFRIAEGIGKKSNTLIVEPFARPNFTNLIIDEEILIKPAIFTDKARASSSSAPAATVSAPETGTGEAKSAIARDTGDMSSTKPESKAGTGQKPGSGGVTGATATPVGGTVKPDAVKMAVPTATTTTTTPPTATTAIASGAAPSAIATTSKAGASQEKNATTKVEGPVKITKPDGTVVETTITTEQKLEPTQVTRKKTTKTDVTKTEAATQTTTKVEAVTITEGKTKTVTTITEPGKQPATTTKEEKKVSAQDQKLLEQAKASVGSSTVAATGAGAPANADPVTGLPNQKAGFIDLKDGRAEAEVIADESRRVKGYEDSYTLVMNSDTLQLVPGQIVALSKRLFPDPFATEKRIATVDHNFQAGTTTINTYTPQAQLPAGSTNAVAAASPSSPTQLATPTSAPGKFIFPVPKGATTIGDGYGTRANREPGYRHNILDITAPRSTPAVAMADGIVTDIAPNAGGAGNLMTITHGGGYVATYMHGVSGKFALVPVGAQVKQGQDVFLINSTGGSTGDHLHLKFTLNGSYCLLSRVGIDVLKLGLPLEQYNKTCDKY